MLCIGANELVKGGNESALDGKHDAGLSIAGAFAVVGLTCTLRIILNNRPLRQASRFGRLLRRPTGIGLAGSFCVVSGSSPIWLSAHQLPLAREDGKFKKWVNKLSSFLFFPSGNLCQYRFGLGMHNVKSAA